MDNVILLVDDDIGFRESVKLVLDLEGYDVLEADNGFEALEILKANPIDLIITDILMPGMDGVELSCKVYDIKLNLKIIGLTGGGRTISRETLGRTLSEYFDAFLIKPFARGELLIEVEKLLG